MNSKFQSGKPVQIVSLNGNSGFKFEKQAASAKLILCSPDVANRKVISLSVAGEFRQGKSFLLSCIIHLLEQKQQNNEVGNSGWLMNDVGTLKGFEWRAGSKRETTGIWMWSKPFIIELASGEEVAVLLIDTQGMFDHQSSVNDNTSIFALSLILSSVQIYNLFSKIPEDRLEILQYFMEFARCAMDKADSAAFQHLIFLIRDWPNADEYEYGFGGGARYLDQVLQIGNGGKKENEMVRKSLRRSFENLSCQLMPRPGDVVATSKEFKGNLADIPKAFKMQLANLCDCLVSAENARVKSVNGRPVNGKQLFDLFESCVKVFQSGQLPEAKTAVQGLAEQTNLAAVRRATIFYKEKMEAAFEWQRPVQYDEFNDAHQRLRLEAKQVFDRSPKLGDEEISRRFAADLEKEITELHKTFLKSNDLKWENRRKAEELTAAIFREKEEQKQKENALAKAAEEQERRLHQEQLAAQTQEALEQERKERAKAEKAVDEWRAAAAQNQQPGVDGGLVGAAIGAAFGPIGAGVGWFVGKFF